MRRHAGRRHLPLIVALLLLTPLLAVVRPQPVAAAGVVSQCTEAGLLAALVGGGLVTFDGCTTITLADQLLITEDTVIDGGGVVELAGGGGDRLIEVVPGVAVTVTGLTLRGGRTVDGLGDAIYNEGTLTVTASTLSGNSATSAGGAITNEGTLTVTASTFTSNSTGFDSGGAIVNAGTLTVTASTFTDNIAFAGGAIANVGTLTLTASTFTDNIAFAGGAITNVGTLTLTASILSGSDLCFGSVISGGYNVASDATCNLTADGDLQNADPLLGPLQDNGGPTQTMLPQPGSPALDRVPNATCATLSAANDGRDQRGSPRPVDAFPCDSGAVEVGVVIQHIAVSVVGSQVTLLVTAVDPLGGPLAYRFVCAGGVLGPQSSPQAVCDYGRQTGQFAVEVEVTDSHGFGMAQTVLVELPTYLCVGERSGTPRLMDNPGGCARGEQPLVLTAAGSWSFCVGELSGSLRYLFNGNASCSRGEWQLNLPGQGPITVCVGQRSGSMRLVETASCLRGEAAWSLAHRVPPL